MRFRVRISRLSCYISTQTQYNVDIDQSKTSNCFSQQETDRSIAEVQIIMMYQQKALLTIRPAFSTRPSFTIILDCNINQFQSAQYFKYKLRLPSNRAKEGCWVSSRAKMMIWEICCLKNIILSIQISHSPFSSSNISCIS